MDYEYKSEYEETNEDLYGLTWHASKCISALSNGLLIEWRILYTSEETNSKIALFDNFMNIWDLNTKGESNIYNKMKKSIENTSMWSEEYNNWLLSLPKYTSILKMHDNIPYTASITHTKAYLYDNYDSE
jgi:hypothetical protein